MRAVLFAEQRCIMPDMGARPDLAQGKCPQRAGYFSMACVAPQIAAVSEQDLLPCSMRAEALTVHASRSWLTFSGLVPLSTLWLPYKRGWMFQSARCGLGWEFLNHEERLTEFLRHAGAALGNNECERGIKSAIRHRKN